MKPAINWRVGMQALTQTVSTEKYRHIGAENHCSELISLRDGLTRTFAFCIECATFRPPRIMDPVTLVGGEHAVLLVHGLQSSPAEMLPLAKRLHKSGYTVHMPHIRGYGYRHGDDAHSVTHWQDWHARY